MGCFKDLYAQRAWDLEEKEPYHKEQKAPQLIHYAVSPLNRLTTTKKIEQMSRKLKLSLRRLIDKFLKSSAKKSSGPAVPR